MAFLSAGRLSPDAAETQDCRAIHHSRYSRDQQTGLLTDIVLAAAIAIWLGFALLVIWEGV